MAAGNLFHLYIAQFSIGIGAGILGVTRAYVSERSFAKIAQSTSPTLQQLNMALSLCYLSWVVSSLEVGRKYR